MEKLTITKPDDWHVHFREGELLEKLVTENKDLYGSIKPTEISKLISENEKVEIKPSSIQPLKEIKSLGTFKVKIDLHSEVQAEIKIKVDSLDQSK